ncbi:uncharacterized protein [Aegilops tauschii subsp. strangulata]|uniref:uncharacterized protein isoform X3 n=1 Tax=Aegilops tauschii subsp. strangulata TaxID=200361 RepID=UPI00098ADEC9|nr:uncharacterized protein LOC109767334 isoform X3 [Aegilops tauschii subsp. strangulata]
MDFRFGAGDRGPPGYTSSVPGPLPPPLEWQAPPRELVIREQVTRRLTEEWAKGDPAFARDLNRGFGPDPFFAPDRFMPPPPHAPMPMPMHPLPHAPPPVPFEEFGGWQGFGPPRLHVHAGFGERTRFLFGARWGSTPRPDPKHKLKLLEVEPSGRPEALSPKVPMMKSKADANAATIVPKKVQKLAEDWSCAPPYQVSAPSESGLNEHLGGREHKAKLAQCGVSKATKGNKSCLQTTTGNVNNTDPCDAPKKICMLVDSATCEAGLNEDLGGRKHEAKLVQCGVSKAIKDDKNCLQMTTGNENNTDPCDAPKEICMLVDGEMHEVVWKNNYLWCDRCRVRCDSKVIMAGHLRSKNHSKLNKVWTSIKAVRTNTDTKEGLPSCGSQALSSNPKVPTMKRKTDANAATTVPKKVQKLAKDWSCALCQVSAPCEAALNEHLGGRKHKAKLAQCGVSKAIKDDKNCLQTPTGNENSTDPCDAPRKICMLVDGATCEAGLNEHLGGSKHKAKLAQCGVSKAIKDDKNCLQTPTGNENSTDPCDAPRKICMLVDGATCEAGLNDHLGGRKHKAKLAQCGVSKTIKDDKNCLQTTTGNENSTDPCDAPKKMCMLVDGAPSEGGLNEHLGGRKHKAKLAQCGVSKAIKDDKNCLQATTGNENSTDPCDAPKKICMLVDGATCEAGLTEHLGGRNIKAKLAQCGASKAIKDDKNSLHTTTGNKNSTDPCDAPKKIFLLIDGEMHEVVQKNKHLWCDRCRVRCYSNATMAGHLRSKKHSKLNKVWTSIKAVRTNTDTKEGLPSCGSQVNTNGSTEIPAVIEGDINMTTKVDESGPVENPVQKEIHLRSKKHSKLNNVWTSIKAVRTNTETKEGLPSCGSQVNTNGSTESPAVIEGGINTTTEVDESGPVENPVQKEIHLRSKKYSKLDKVWTSIKAVRTNTDSKEGLLSCGSQALSSNPKVPMVKRKADANAATTVPKKVQKPTKDWSCALCLVSRQCEAALNAHLGGTKHKAKLAQCGVSKTIKDGKNCSQTTTGNENSTDPCDAPKKICMLVDSAMHEVVRKDNYLWCDHCRVSCDNYATMACHLRCKKQSKLTKVCSSIKAVRTNTNTKEGLPSFGSQVNTNGSTEIPAVIEGDINMTTAVDESGPVENPVGKEMTRMATIKAVRTNTDTKEGLLSSCGSRVNTNGSIEIPAIIEGDINMTTAVYESGPVENPVRKVFTRMATIKAVRTNTGTKESLPSSCGSQVNTNGSTEIPAVIEGDINMTTAVDESGPVENPVQKEIQRMATIWAMFSC